MLSLKRICWRIFVVFFIASSVKADYDIGYEKYFETNLKEIENYPIYFRRPLPKWLSGTLVRNGLGRFEVGDRSFSHAFDAFGKLSSWKFTGNGSAFFSTKFIQSKYYQKSVFEKSIYPYQLLDKVKPPYNYFEKLGALTRGMGNMNVNIYQLTNSNSRKHEYVVMNDCWNMFEVEPFYLSTLRSVRPDVPKKSLEYFALLSSAHPLPEPETTNYLDFLVSFNVFSRSQNKIQLIRIKSADIREQVASFSIDRLPYMHSFAVTKNYAIFFAMPFNMNLHHFTKRFEVLDSMQWSNTDPIHVYVISLKTGKVRKLMAENGFYMHHINAFESGISKIIVDIPVYKNPDAILAFEMDTIRNRTLRNNIFKNSRLTRYFIDLHNNKITQSQFMRKNPVVTSLDMPTINEKYRYRSYCYVYGIVQKMDGINTARTALTKTDLCGNSTDEIWYSPNQYPAEAWFVPFPNGTKEDDGYLLTPVFDGAKLKSHLVIIDAKTMKTINFATLPIANPMTTHGRFFSGIF